MAWAGTEKQALVATLRSSDPTAPTLDPGWSVVRLLAHLVQREQGPVAMVSDAVSRRPPGQEPGLSRLVEAARTPEGYQALVDRFVAGAPRWSPMSWAGEQVNLLEYVIHHEDIRRGAGTPAAPRELPDGQRRAVWKQLSVFSRLSLRKAPGGVTLTTPSGSTRVVRPGDGVTLAGDPVELALYVSGRRNHADVLVTGPAELVSRFDAWAASA